MLTANAILYQRKEKECHVQKTDSEYRCMSVHHFGQNVVDLFAPNFYQIKELSKKYGT